MKLTLTQDERKAIFRGDHRALKRPTKPDVKAGDKRVLSWTRGGRQIVDRETGATIEIPRKPTVWIEFKQPELRDGEWIAQFIARDIREPTRYLGSTPGPPTEAGLKTRWRSPEAVADRGEAISSWTQESERGYTGSGRTAIDPAEGVDDGTLETFSAQARNTHVEFKRELETEKREMKLDARKKWERGVRSRLSETLAAMTPDEQVNLLARIEQELKKCGRSGIAALPAAAAAA